MLDSVQALWFMTRRNIIAIKTDPEKLFCRVWHPECSAAYTYDTRTRRNASSDIRARERNRIEFVYY